MPSGGRSRWGKGEYFLGDRGGADSRKGSGHGLKVEVAGPAVTGEEAGPRSERGGGGVLE